MEEQKGGGAAATANIEDNTFEALEKDFQEVRDFCQNVALSFSILKHNEKPCLGQIT